MPTKTAADVVTRAIQDLGTDFSQQNFPDDATFQAYALVVANEVIAEHTARVDPYSLDNIDLFNAAKFETMSRLARRIRSLYYSGVLSSESITLGPISLSQAKNELVAKDIGDYADQLHGEAEAWLGAGGARGRRGAIRVWVPRNRIVIA